MKRLLAIMCVFIFSGTVSDGIVKNASAVSDTGDAAKSTSLSKIERYPYTAGGRREPFASIITAAKKKMEVKRKSANPLENFDVADFKLLGVINDGKAYYASVVLPDNKAYTLTRGMRVGVHGGKVEKITFDKVVIEEFVVNFMGNLEKKYTEINLRKEEEK